MEDGVLGLEWVLVQGPRETDSEVAIAWRKFIAEGPQGQYVWVEWRAGEEAGLNTWRIKL